MKKELVKILPITRESGWCYFVDGDGDVARGRMGGIVSYNPLQYAEPEKVLKVGITRKSGYLYGVDHNCDIFREPMPSKYSNRV